VAGRPGNSVFFSPGPFWCARCPPRTAVTFHDCIYHHFPRYRGKRLLRRWLLGRRERFLARCAAVFTESEHAAGEIAGLRGCDAGHIHAIPAWLPPGYTAADAARNAPDVRKRYGLPERYWLYVGGYDYRKHIDQLLEAYAAMAAQAPPLVLAGSVPTDLAKPVCDVHGTIARLELSASVVLPGFVEDVDMPGLYAGAELFVYPSRYEGFGLPPLEAMGCGCPAICADNTSLREVVTDREYRFETDTAGELQSLLERAARERLALNPSFDPLHFDEATAIRRYAAVLSRIGQEGDTCA
jgi:glycosyltransferase involved in cell wall biosynthesis